MTHKRDDQTVSAPQSSAQKEEALYFNTVTLSRFMRASYGRDAAKEAQRHVDAYMAAKQPDIADIWRRVVAHISGIELKDDPRRLVKSTRPNL
jgi:phosphoenolpyruvate-protein kinase (PTS system EI component)